MSKKDLPLWRVSGYSKTGGSESEVKIRAEKHQDAVESASRKHKMVVKDCVLAEGNPANARQRCIAAAKALGAKEESIAASIERKASMSV